MAVCLQESSFFKEWGDQTLEMYFELIVTTTIQSSTEGFKKVNPMYIS